MRSAKTKPPYIIEPLGKRHARDVFSCGKEKLDDYLKKQASQDARRKVAAPFVLVKRGKSQVLGYYTLSSYGILLEDLPDNVIKNLPRYPVVPATLLGRLAVDENHQGKRLGELLLIDALYRSLNQADVIASTAVVVEAKDKEALDFYTHFNFIKFKDRTDRLFLPMKTIGKLF